MAVPSPCCSSSLHSGDLAVLLLMDSTLFFLPRDGLAGSLPSRDPVQCAPCIFIIPRDLPLPVWASTHLPAARHLGEQQGESVWPSLPSPGFYKGRHSSSSCQAGCLPPPPALHQGERLGDSVWPSLPSPGFYKGRRSSSSCWAGCGVPSTTTWFS